ncbi:MAG: 16S rRNA (adenine(1518)-N(6)/adenine(1519)-N(6))-dimethyltransferase RsmA [Myxococcota bacterium]|nr:16S rRNA (adenine(1518)-N(6)/adenine(1519)-N(6))-dimethyltransferase RsmA [Myxococcota bacterium]
MNRAQTRALLARRGLRLRRELGQNFLIDEPQARRLAELACVGEGDVVLEIGTGLGALTRALAERASRVVTLEVDSGVVAALREESLLPPGVELHHADALETRLAPLIGTTPRDRAKVVANLPYSAATPLLRALLDLRECFGSWSVMLQREVALRLTAKPGERDYGSFAVLHSLAAQLEVVAQLPAGVFFPAPKVVSSFVRITPRREAELSGAELRAVERVVRAAFGQRRKTLANALRGGGFGERCDAAIEAVGVDPRARAETLEPEAFRRLAAALAPDRSDEPSR